MTISGVDITPIRLGSAIVALMAGWLGGIWLSKFIVRSWRHRDGSQNNSAIMLGRVVRYLSTTVGLLIAINIFGIPISRLFTAGALVAVAVGFATQNIVQNLVAGLIMIGERSIKLGDLLEYNGEIVRVTNMGIRATIVRAPNDTDVIIPNSTLVTSSVRNYTLRDTQLRVGTTVGVSYDSDMKLVREVLEKVGKELTFPAREPLVLMQEFADSSVNWNVFIWIEEARRGLVTKSVLNETVWFALKDAGVTIAYPQLDLHVKQLPTPPE